MNEEWISIAGYENRYMISSFGRILKMPVNDDPPRVMKPKIDRDGYLRIGLTNANGRKAHYLVHRLVYKSFICSDIREGYDVHHVNKMKTHNVPSNLKEISHKEHNQGTRSYGAKLTEEAVGEIWKLHYKGLPNIKIARIYGVCSQLIDQIIGGKRWTHVVRPQPVE